MSDCKKKKKKKRQERKMETGIAHIPNILRLNLKSRIGVICSNAINQLKTSAMQHVHIA